MRANATRLLQWIAALATIVACGPLALAQQPPAPPPAPPVAPSAPALPAPLTEYMGRKIAPVMGYEAAPWLERAERQKEERCGELLTALELKPGQVVADVGCGSGFYTFKLAQLVGEKGKVYAVDVQPEMLELVKKEAARIGVEKTRNVEPILGTIVDPKLPDASVDLAFLVDTYHELGRPAEMLAALAKALKKDGRIVLVEFRLEDPEVPIKLLHKMSKEQMRKELAASGFEVASEYDRLPWQHVVFFRVSTKPRGDASPPSPRDQTASPQSPVQPPAPPTAPKPKGDGLAEFLAQPKWSAKQARPIGLTGASRSS